MLQVLRLPRNLTITCSKCCAGHEICRMGNHRSVMDAPLGHRRCLKNSKTMCSLAPKNWFQNDIESQIRHVSPPAHENDWQPVHWWIHAGDGNIVSPHPSVAKQKQTTKQRKRRNQNTNKAIHAGEGSNTAPCGNQGSPQPGSPRSHGASRMA